MNMKTLDIGCGNGKTDGAVGIDMRENPGVDIVWDLNKTPWPLEDNAFDRIVCRHIIEHLDDIAKTMSEIYRTAKEGAIVEIRVPHFSSLNAYRDPTHRHYLSLHSFDVFCANGRYFSQSVRFSPVSRRLTFGSSFLDIPGRIISRLSPERYERRFAWIFPARHVEITLKVLKTNENSD
ncbi:MAG: class I SAM-dependent methyltransferase [Planctomycetota bacterium]|jgi:ubiquinone/menaquinone biosynthesis C-methylase UbiE